MSNNFISEAEAVRLSIAELRDLHHALATALAESEHGSPEAVQIAASLRAVMNELNRRNRLSRSNRP
ncbi:hypothetical protein [Hyphomonas sp.]|uniref:hypothetical protein n=1 Tax=Hyphomonas sp. TaxID=87 RepID=UPI00260372C2|nr:hypothetical protein [Hyphomonas sp.]MDF1807767.1 hypothetical protein [Hyphomonas sp.]